MQFNTLVFMLFFIITALLYFVSPKKAKNWILLTASYVFYGLANAKILIYLLLCTLVTYGFGLLIEENKGKDKAKLFVTIAIILDIGVLAFFKYTDFAISIIGRFTSLFGANPEEKTLGLIAPLGISFITFQTVSYMIDVNRGKTPVCRSLLKYALYVAFFPIVIQGPISKAGDIIPQFDEEHKYDSDRVKEGIILFLFGLFMKMVIADRAALTVDHVFADLNNYSGAAILFSTILFALQLYADFAGYSLMAIGSAKILGFNVKRNFRQPYFSKSPAEFWRRWHISLNTWLKDYLYIPLGGSRCSKTRQYFNVMATFTLSGLWHGANVGYVLWGFINGIFVVIDNIIHKGKAKAKKAGNAVVGFLKALFNSILLLFTWVFFRARYFSLSMLAFKRMFTAFNCRPFLSAAKHMLLKRGESTLLGMTFTQYMILFAGFIVLWVADYLTSRNDNMAERIAKGNTLLRWLVVCFLLMSVICFGIYGFGYNAAAFVYTQF